MSLTKKILEKLQKADQIRISIPSYIVVFKELTVPFLEIDKIKMVVEYESEPILPFSLDEAIIDFIITKQIIDEKKSQILVAAVRKQDLKNILDIYTNAGIDPTSISIDLFALYGLYKQIPEYNKLSHGSALVDIGTQTTRIAFLLNGQLHLIRTIQKGLETVAEHINKDIQMPHDEIMKTLKEYGVKHPTNEEYSQAANKHMVNLLHDIQFTLNSFSLQLNLYKGISKILFVVSGSVVNGLMSFSSNLLQIPCELFSCAKLLNTVAVKNKIKKTISDWSIYIYSLGTALYYIPHREFDLKQKEFALSHHKLMRKQLATVLMIIFGIFIMLTTTGYLQINKLSNHAIRTEKKAIRKLKNLLPPNTKALKKKRLKDIIKSAEEEMEAKKEILAPFSNEGIQPLEVLEELTKIIDKRRFASVTTEHVIITRTNNTSEVEVTGFFKAKPGEQFDPEKTDSFIALEKSFDLSETLILIQKPIDFLPAEDGIRFTAILKLKKQQD